MASSATKRNEAWKKLIEQRKAAGIDPENMRNSCGFLYRLTPIQSRRVSTLVKNECCNYDAGNCELLDDGKYHPCPQIGDKKIACRWFRKAVLPLDPALELEICAEGRAIQTQHEQTTASRNCAVCGSMFIPMSNRSKYCPNCAQEITRIQGAKRQQKRRMHVTH